MIYSETSKTDVINARKFLKKKNFKNQGVLDEIKGFLFGYKK